MTQVGDLKTRLYFDKHGTTDDGYGNVVGDFFQQFWRFADVTYRLGGEQVLAARLEGRSPVNITVRRDPETVTIGQDWRARDDEGVIYNIKSVAKTPDANDYWIKMLAEVGGNVA